MQGALSSQAPLPSDSLPRVHTHKIQQKVKESKLGLVPRIQKTTEKIAKEIKGHRNYLAQDIAATVQKRTLCHFAVGCVL